MNARDRRALFWGAVVVGGAVVGLRVLPWSVRWMRATHADLRERATLLARAREDLALLPVLRDSTAVLTRAIVALGPRLLAGATPAEAAADLSGAVNLAASRAPAKVERLDQVADSAAEGRLARTQVHVGFETDVRGLLAFLRSIERGDPALAVEELRVVAPDPASIDRAPEILKVEALVSGWYRKGKS